MSSSGECVVAAAALSGTKHSLTHIDVDFCCFSEVVGGKGTETSFGSTTTAYGNRFLKSLSVSQAAKTVRPEHGVGQPGWRLFACLGAMGIYKQGCAWSPIQQSCQIRCPSQQVSQRLSYDHACGCSGMHIDGPHTEMWHTCMVAVRSAHVKKWMVWNSKASVRRLTMTTLMFAAAADCTNYCARITVARRPISSTTECYTDAIHRVA